MFQIIKNATDECNPYGLLPDAPSNEFDSESRKIAGQISINSTAEEIANIISNMLSKAFGENFEINKCMSTVKKIHMNIHN